MDLSTGQCNGGNPLIEVPLPRYVTFPAKINYDKFKCSEKLASIVHNVACKRRYRLSIIGCLLCGITTYGQKSTPHGDPGSLPATFLRPHAIHPILCSGLESDGCATY